jgi:polyribonucleotide nucleotidyltransferase
VDTTIESNTKIKKNEILEFWKNLANKTLLNLIKLESKEERTEKIEKLKELETEIFKYHKNFSIWTKSENYNILEDDQKFKRFLNKVYSFEILKVLFVIVLTLFQ